MKCLSYFPSHLKRVATLPCKNIKSACFGKQYIFEFELITVLNIKKNPTIQRIGLRCTHRVQSCAIIQCLAIRCIQQFGGNSCNSSRKYACSVWRSRCIVCLPSHGVLIVVQVRPHDEVMRQWTDSLGDRQRYQLVYEMATSLSHLIVTRLQTLKSGIGCQQTDEPVISYCRKLRQSWISQHRRNWLDSTLTVKHTL